MGWIKEQYGKRKGIVLAAAVLFALFALGLAAGSLQTDQLAVHFLDVGQGDAIFIETPAGYQVLIDGGRDGTVMLEQLADAMPAHDRHIDMVIATHTDADHIGGLVAVLERFEVGELLAGEVVAESDVAGGATERGVPIRLVERGDQFTFDNNIRLLVLFPTSEFLKNASDNDTSVVTKLTYGNDTFLFTGDLEKRGEFALVQAGIDLDVDVLKLGHHGSNTSSTAWFLSAATPNLAIIQVGKNPYGHPHTEVLSRLGAVPVLRNDLQGDITLYSDGNRF
ncbi:MAG: ComEC/Rec2 family competence protein [Candidatus Spechtbacterales bacterium]